MCIYIYIHTYIHTYIHIHIVLINVCVHIYAEREREIHAYIGVQPPALLRRPRGVGDLSLYDY